MVEEMLIARVHVHVKVLQVRGAQYKYRGHVVHFLRNVGRLFEELPVLPQELDIVLLRPPNMEGDPHFQQQFARDFRCHHPGYRDIVVPQGPVEEAMDEDPSDADASAIPNLQVTDTELNALQSRFQRTPINEFNRSQPLLTLAFPTLYPDGKADFVEPRLRSITYQDYLGHAMRWRDGRFARHKTWPFVALNTLLRAQVRKRSDYFVRQRDSRRQPLTRADLEEAMAEPDEPEAQALIQSITRQAAELEAYAYNLGRPGLFATAIVLKRKFNLTDFWVDLDPDNDRSRERFARIWGYYISAINPEPRRIQHWSFRGARNDGQINHYNRLLTVAWLANTDVSPCTSLQQVIDYAAKYCSKHSRYLRIDGDEVDEAPNVYEKYSQRPEALTDLTYVSFLKFWNFRSRDPSKWKQWQPGNVHGRPRQQWPDYCRAFSYCWQHHSHDDDHYGQPSEARLQPQEDQYEALPVEEEFDDEDWIRLAALLPDHPLTQEDLDILGHRDIDVNYDWSRHVGTYPELRDGYWKDLIASHPVANNVEVLGPHWRDELNPQQRLVYDTFIGHFQAQNPTQILLHVDGGGGTAALPNPSPICRVAPTGVASNQIQGSTIHSLLRLPVGGPFTDLPPTDAAALQSRLRHVKYLVIDEKSMLGLEQLARIDSRLRQAFPQRKVEFFGGVSVLLVGDFFQLPPVRKGQVAYRLFDRTVFLITVQRQVGDDQAQFRQAFNRVQARLMQGEVDSFSTALRVYSTKARVNEYNHEHMGAGQAPSDNAGNLSNKFPVAKGARVMLTTNLWQPAGLVNGAQAVIMVDFDSYDGPSYLTTNEGRKISPILPSLTKDQIVTDLASRDFQAGISYVAVSRVTSLQGLLLEAPFDRQSLYNHAPTEGMKMRLADQKRRQAQQLTDAPYPPLYLD
ncbi:PIF1-like helicase domain-containing protein [Hirsutella rhossiliensis]|uniref:ATP-dependent DNA helicase n=1 Tax=Hirsutella rhossiliensis TaxID=111463 RepID=A0A9P8MR77_9HYPO|nr:PIF1-like helicase domain-containing protein [Hirsutella rhossiliensis]KAH0959800.1 PIF1-like helicase domain-containing protein [Hirsutella rhossiliensis]